MKNIKNDKHLTYHILLIIAIMITFTLSCGNIIDFIKDESYKNLSKEGYLTSSDYGEKLDEIHAYINNSLYIPYINAHDEGVKNKDLTKAIKKQTQNIRESLKLDIISNYGSEVSYFIVDNNLGEVYTNVNIKSAEDFAKNYNKDGFTYISTKNNLTETYVNKEKKLLNVSYNLSNNFDMENNENSYLRNYLKEPTVMMSVNNEFSESGYFKDNSEYFKNTARFSVIGIILLLTLLIYLLKLLKNKFGIKESCKLIAEVFNSIFIEIKILAILLIYNNIFSPKWMIVGGIFIFCLYCAIKFDNDNLLKSSIYKKIHELYQNNQVMAEFSKKVQSRIVFTITKCVISGGIALFLLFLLATGLASFGEFITALWLIDIAYLFYSIFKLYTYSIKSIKDIDDVYNYTLALGKGEFKNEIHLSENSYYKEIEYNLNTLNEHIKETVEEQVKSEKMKSELITNVSHDLKTPLTSIINYVDLMKRENIKPNKAKEYLDILDIKSQKLKKLVEDIFEISKAASGNIELRNDNINLKSILNQSVSEFTDSIEENNLEIRMNAKDDIFVYSDGERLGRVLENLIQNAVKYSLKGTRIYIDLEVKENTPTIAITNISNYEMNFTSEEILRRFARADRARDLDGFGLGLSIVQSFTDLMNIEFNINIDKDLFKATLKFR